MPCYISMIRFLQCGHTNLFKLSCTANCQGLCPPSSQEILLVSRYLWSCEDCHQRAFNRAEDERCERWAARARDVTARYPAEAQRPLLTVVRSRELSEDRRCEAKRVSQVEEIQWVGEWTLELGLMIHEVLYKRSWPPRDAAKRIQQLRDLRLWDLVVVKDATRSTEKLIRSQAEPSFWRAQRGIVAQRRKRLAKRPPAANQPPPPLFPIEETREGRAAQRRELERRLEEQLTGVRRQQTKRTTPRSKRDSGVQTDSDADAELGTKQGVSATVQEKGEGDGPEDVIV
ncbi:hypothetical protein ACJ41O_013325 [Fusarium nematophilum]